MSVVIFTGVSRYADPWHPVADTSDEIARVVSALGLRAEVRTDESPRGLADLSGVDLLVVNSGGGDPANPPLRDPGWEPAYAGLAAHVASGGALLVVHSGANAFPEWDGWDDIVGTGWVPGTSGHPVASMAVFEADPSAVDHPVFAGIGPVAGVTERPAVVCYDERYWQMPTRPGNVPLLGHVTHDDWYVMGWSRGDRVLFDGMGHDRRSYASAHRRQYLANEVRWLLRDRVTTTTGGEL